MYIPEILRRHRIMGRNRREPCKCGHFHSGKEVIIIEDPVEAALWAIEEKRKLLEDEPIHDSYWVETPTEYIKKTSFGDIVIKKHPKKR